VIVILVYLYSIDGGVVPTITHGLAMSIVCATTPPLVPFQQNAGHKPAVRSNICLHFISTAPKATTITDSYVLLSLL